MSVAQDHAATIEQSKALIEGRPIADFDIAFRWHGGQWAQLFDAQIALIQADVRRAKTADKLVIYLSCPISAWGGSHSGTNVDIALTAQRRLLDTWGEGAWILNPANYQMESRLGTGLMNMHAERLGIDLDALIAATGMPGGGDYMRMWTTVLVENDLKVGRAMLDPKLKDTGQYFDAFYFIGAEDARSFFKNGNETLTAAIEAYFARRIEADPDFRDAYSGSVTDWGASVAQTTTASREARDDWRLKRSAFLRYYMFRAGVNFSPGSHDEWNIWRKLNQRRREAVFAGLTEQIPGFFDGRQIAPGATEAPLSPGYAA